MSLGESTEHRILLDNRKSLQVYGVIEVLSFDEGGASLITEAGALDIEGKGLAVKNLSNEKGLFEIEGEVDAFYYKESKEKSGKRFLFFS